MAFPRNLLNRDEEIVLDLTPHWWYLTPAGAILAVALVIGIASVAGDWPSALQWLIGLGVLAALVNFGLRYLRWVSTNFVVTNERVIYRAGVISKQGIEIPLDRINTVFFHQGLFERMIGAGDVAIESASEGGRQTFSDIRGPNGVQQEIYRQMEAEEQRNFDQAAEATARAFRSQNPPQSTPSADPTPTPPSTPTVPPAGTAQPPSAVPPADGGTIGEKIQQLADMRAQGLITKEEYDRKKAELLDRM